MVTIYILFNFIFIYKNTFIYLLINVFDNLVTFRNANMNVMEEYALIMIYVIVI